jgi:tetratricopeptide (TPR) repeat protein
VAFAGDLKKLPIADVFQSIHQNSMTGALAIRDGHGERLVAFKGGFVIGCAGPVGEEHGIADELVRRQKIDAKDARPSRFFRRKGSLLKSLTKRNLMDQGEFASMTRSLVLERVYDCFLLEEGTFEFLETYDQGRFDEDEASADVKVAPAEILMEAMRRIDEFKRIKRSVPSFREVYVATRPPAEDDKPIVRDLLSQMAEGTKPLHEVFHAIPHTKFACCEAVLTLVNSGDLRVATAPEYLDLGRKAEDKAQLDAAASYYARGLAYERGNRELNTRRIGILEKLRRNQEAADERKVYAGILLEHGDRKAASEQYVRAAELAPSDPLPLERMLDLQVEAKDLREASHSADRLVRVYLQLGLGDKAKGVYPRLLVLNPRDRSLRERLAEVHMKLHEPSTAATIWKELAQEELDKGDQHDAAMLLRRAIEAQPDDSKTQALLKDLDSGEHAARRRRYRRYGITATLSLVGGVALAWFAQETAAVLQLRELDRDLLGTVDRGAEGVLGALIAREGHREAWDGTWAARWDEEASVELARMFVRQLQHEAVRPRYEPLALPKQPVPKVLEELRGVLDPEGGASLEVAVESAEAALAPPRTDKETAWRELIPLLERARAARLALARAGAEGRALRSLEEDQRRLYPLLARIQLLWARLSVTSPVAEQALDVEAGLRLAPPVPPAPPENGAATPPSEPPPGSTSHRPTTERR